MNLKNKVVYITGGGSGIGKACAMAYGSAGAKVVIADVDEKSGKKVVKALEKKGSKALFVHVDTSDAESVKESIEMTVKKFKKLDIAVNNAGIGGPQKAPHQYPLDGWNNVIDINLNGVFYGMKYQLPHILKSKGSIVNMASILGAVGTPQSPAYVAAKHGVIGLTKASALAYAGKGVRINAVGPGYVKTPLVTENISEKQMKQLVAAHPIGRLGKPEEIAELVLWLSSDKASFVTGSYYNIDGGYLAQ